MAARRRLDAELVRRGLVPSRARARELIEEGRVTVAGAPAGKASRMVDPAEAIEVAGDPPRFVSRAGEKLDAATQPVWREWLKLYIRWTPQWDLPLDGVDADSDDSDVAESKLG